MPPLRFLESTGAMLKKSCNVAIDKKAFGPRLAISVRFRVLDTTVPFSMFESREM